MFNWLVNKVVKLIFRIEYINLDRFSIEANNSILLLLLWGYKHLNWGPQETEYPHFSLKTSNVLLVVY